MPDRYGDPQAHHDPIDYRARALAVVDCGLCDDDGYRGATVCDHVDRSAIAARGMAKVRAALASPDAAQAKEAR